MKIELPFHIHVDATVLPFEIRKLLHKQGFVDADFAGHPHGYVHFEPNAHMTLKFDSKQAFQDAFRRTCGLIEKTDFVGYLEAEYVLSDVAIPSKAFDSSIIFPFQVVRRLLSDHRDTFVGQTFRETEFHLVLDKDASDPRLIQRMLEAGLYGAYIQKKDWTGLVLTMQGSKREIDPLTGMLHQYLVQAGGAIRATLQEERAIAYRLFGVKTQELPEVVDKVAVFSPDLKARSREAVRMMRRASNPSYQRLATVR